MAMMLDECLRLELLRGFSFWQLNEPEAAENRDFTNNCTAEHYDEL
jgi:hypothetical protein